MEEPAGEPAEISGSSSEPLSERRPRSPAGCFVVGILLLLVFYCLSPAFVIKLLGPNPTPSGPVYEFLEVVYRPIEWGYENFSPVRKFYDWYFHVMGVR